MFSRPSVGSSLSDAITFAESQASIFFLAVAGIEFLSVNTVALFGTVQIA
jgi:hypothetical protein